MPVYTKCRHFLIDKKVEIKLEGDEMKELGVSIYPSKSNVNEDKEYLKTASGYGFTRIFTSLLEITGDQNEVVDKYKEIIQYGNDLGMSTVLDVNPTLFDQLGASYEDLSFFKQLGAKGIRLDHGFGGSIEAQMTKDDSGLDIEINMSGGTKYVDQIMSHLPNSERLIASHNFYPMTYSGLSRAHFDKTTARFNKYNLKTAAFVNSEVGTLGPWPVQTGLVTLEEHRSLPLHVQIAHYKALGTIEDLIIGNAYASEEELKLASEVFFSPHILIPVELSEDITAIEKKIILEELHTYRGDHSAYMIRSSQTRVKYKDENFPVGKTNGIEKGSIIIGNNDFGQYKGETQIALLPMKDEGTRNIVGNVQTDAIYLIEDLKPYASFKLIEI